MTASTVRPYRPTTPTAVAHALTTRLFAAGLAAAELMAMLLADRLGVYAALAQGPATPAQLAVRCRMHERFARELLEQQTVAGILTVDAAERPAADRCYTLPAGHRQVLAAPGAAAASLALSALPVAGLAPLLPQIAMGYASGDGVPPAAYAAGFASVWEAVNRPVFDQLPRWIEAAMPDLAQRLAVPGGAIVDLGCGPGWSTLALAARFPQARVTGVDRDTDALARARGHASVDPAAAGRPAGAVRFTTGLPAPGAADAGADLVCILDALHDMADPVGTLAACRAILRTGGALLLMEPRAAERFRPDADETERFLYSVSVLHCLPIGLSERPSAGTGTVLRPDTVREYARAAGFAAVTVLPVDHRFHRLYRLDPPAD